MCDYSLHAIASRPARVGETLISTHFRGSATLGFASPAEKNVAVCLLPGTELAFETNVRYRGRWFKSHSVNSTLRSSARSRPRCYANITTLLLSPTEAQFYLTRWCRANVFGSYNCPSLNANFSRRT
jgi:hypothetical protein